MPPLHLSSERVEELPETDILMGPFADATYHDATFNVSPGDAVVLFTDGLTEAENDEGEEHSVEKVAAALAPLHGRSAAELVGELKRSVIQFTNLQALADDLTLMVVSRDGE